MASEESDDEPLSVLAAAKKRIPVTHNDIDKHIESVPKKKRRNVSRSLIKRSSSPLVIKRPVDVWMYLKDLKPTGPYSCLLCSSWFINRSKILLHYALNHKKDYCGICRRDFARCKTYYRYPKCNLMEIKCIYCTFPGYFVPDRDAWNSHANFHTPWPCSQCVQNFADEQLLRRHLSSVHNLVHCRFCHFQLPDNEEYDKHLFQKHNVTNVSSKNEEIPWELEYDGNTKFHCLFCSKSNILSSAFFNHFMGYHHYTLKCLTNIVCGRDTPFTVPGADITPEFVEKMKDNIQFGYVDLEPQQKQSKHTCDTETERAILPNVKQEMYSDEEVRGNNHNEDQITKAQVEAIKKYKGVEDFDVTLMEVIIFDKCYFNYLQQSLTDINANIMPSVSVIKYDNELQINNIDYECEICTNKFNSTNTFLMHLTKMHGVKNVPAYSCRVCVATFETNDELESHIAEEMGDFDDLWLCQFCDKEFDHRETTRSHLTEHLDMIEYDNCFSPHLGFKCKYCPILFWKETDREAHQLRAHYLNHKDNFYKCDICSDIFGDQVWFVYHYLNKHHTEVQEPKYMLKCCICSLVLKTIDDVRLHFLSHHPEARKIFCTLDACCFKPLSNRKSFKLHLKVVHNPEHRPRPAKCGVCGRQFPNSRACGSHMTQVHGIGKFTCSICKEVMNTMDERKLHYLFLHPGQHPFVCRDCGKSFLYKSSLYMHRQEHTHANKPFTCSFCGKMFGKKDSFREHLQIHEGPRHACSYCPMRFVQRSNMLRHERRHTGERPYACSHCPRTFADKGACNSHIRTHIKDTASFACLYCGQTFIQKSKLTYHIRRHTGENLETCKVCSKLFTSMCSLREHMKTHAPKKDLIKCPMCDKKYRDERTMLRHLRTAHTTAHFTCPLCPKVLANASGLRSHVVTHSPLKTYKCVHCQKSVACRRTVIKHIRRRHNLKTGQIRNHYERLDPREAQLNLDEATMTNIFGPPRKRFNIIGDIVNFATKKKAKKAKIDEKSSDSNDSESDVEKEESPSESREDGGEELEPTDFVSVKIEPLIDENMEDFE